ncbi:hypothetical protein AB835_13595 [Candidatus Endobugula sertula]|uniref:Methanethiol S-methyltransferase n=1 Tax=Candidatus Endobugula sertula TaxID=62101 RepID=A0A1D2QLU9_9GAMM|nr:hypothetical protein AB835_13595 [Candidatus Endobugula sertula]
MTWWMVDLIIIVVYGFQHTLLTTKWAVKIYNKILPDYSWNFVYSILSVVTLVLGFNYWQSSNIYLFHLIPGSFSYHIMLVLLSLSLFFFFYCFKYTTSFWQWLGVKQISLKLMKKPLPAYYKIRQDGVKRYIRFPHHTCLIVFFWCHPVMTLDTLLLAIGATVYLYVGTYHQDLRGLRIIGLEWEEYRKNTCLLIPGPKVISRMISDFKKLFYGSPNANNVVNKD